MMVHKYSPHKPYVPLCTFLIISFSYKKFAYIVQYNPELYRCFVISIGNVMVEDNNPTKMTTRR